MFALDSVVVKTQNCTARMEAYANVSSQRNNKIKLTHYDDTKKMAYGSQIVRAKENLKLSYGGPRIRH